MSSTRDATFLVGDVSVRLHGPHLIVGRVLEELAELPVGGAPQLDIHVSRSGLDVAPPSATTLGPVTVAGDTAWCDWPRTGFTTRIAPAPDGQGVVIDVAAGPRPMPYRMPRLAFRWCEPTFMTPLEAQGYVFLLRVLEGAVFLFGGRAGADTALLHAACVEHAGHAVALTSAGGVGKTSTAAELLRRPGWRYVTDDVLPVTREPTVRYYPRRVMTYAYNLRDAPDLRRRAVRSGGLGGVLQWRALQAMGVERRRRRVPPRELYGEARIGGEACLAAVLFLTRHAGARVELLEADPFDIGRRCASVMADEQSVLAHVMHHWEAVGRPIVSFEEAIERQRAVYQALFSSVGRVMEVRLPASSDAREAADAIAAIVERAHHGAPRT